MLFFQDKHRRLIKPGLDCSAHVEDSHEQFLTYEIVGRRRCARDNYYYSYFGKYKLRTVCCEKLVIVRLAD